MDLIFEPQAGRPFLIEVGYFDTVLEIKEKIEKYQGIPVSMQTLVFNGQTLQDDADIEKCVLLNASHVQLHIDFFKNQNTKEFSPAPSTVKLYVKVQCPSSNIRTLEMDANDTVSRLKERIQQLEPVPINNQLVAHLSGNELHDRRMLLDCGISQFSVLHVSLRPLPVAAATGNKKRKGGGGGSKTLRVTILSCCSGEKISIEVNPSDNVGELRKDLERLQRWNQLTLPSDGYFFIHAQSVMEEDQSFQWHQVAHFDTIEIFSGTVTHGAP